MVRRGKPKESSDIEARPSKPAPGEVNKAVFFAALSLAVFSAMSAVLIVPPLLVEIGTELDVSVPVAGQLATATFAAWAASLLCVGPLSDSLGRRPVALAGLAVLAVSALASAFAPNIEILLALRALTGLAGGTLPPTAVGVLSDVISPARRAQAITAMLAVQGVVAGVTVPMVAVLADLGGWRLPFVVAGALLVSALLVNWVWFPRDKRERTRGLVFFSRYFSLLSLRYFRVAIAVGVTQRISFWATLSFFPSHLLLTYDVPLGLVAVPLMITAVGQVVGSYLAAFVVSNKRRTALLAGTSIAGGLCACLFFSVHLGLWLAVAVVAIGVGFLSVLMPALVAVSTEYSGESKSTGASLMGFTNQSSGAVGAALGGVLLASVSYSGIGYMCLAVTIASALMTPLFGRPLGDTAAPAAAPGSG